MPCAFSCAYLPRWALICHFQGGNMSSFCNFCIVFQTLAQNLAQNLLWNLLEDGLPWGQIFPPICGYLKKPSGFSNAVLHLFPCLDILLRLLDVNMSSALPSWLLSLSKMEIILICQLELPFITGAWVTALRCSPTLGISPPTVSIDHCPYIWEVKKKMQLFSPFTPFLINHNEAEFSHSLKK